MLESFIQLLLSFTEGMGYFGVIFLMAVESSFIPFPSEVVIPPAAYLAHKGVMNIYLVILSGIAGSLIGASVNYYLAMKLGRPAVYALVRSKVARFFLLDEAKVKKSEDFFLKYGRVSTFSGRLVPVVRQLISLPAGFSKMNFASFIFYTFVGSGIWVVVLAVLGYSIGSNEELLGNYYHIIKYALTFAIVLIVVAIIVRFMTGRKKIN